MNKPENLEGKVFGRLTVEKLHHKIQYNNKGVYYWKCLCLCGKEKIVRSQSLKKGDTSSCGCLQKEKTSLSRKKHGLSKTKFYNTWIRMLARTQKVNHHAYRFYGAKGVRIDKKWQKFSSFYEDMYVSFQEHVRKYGERQTTLDRIDPTGNYCKKNCRWTTWNLQRKNQRKAQKNNPAV